MSTSAIFKHGFNLSPMYRRTTARVTHITDDLKEVKIKIPLSYKNKNYVGAIFGGSMFAATDPIYMIQLMQILGEDYVIWDKSATINYKRPAKQALVCEFKFTDSEIEAIKKRVQNEQEITIEKTTYLVNTEKIVFAEVIKILYIAEKQFYKEKLKNRASS
ncbi:PaaI family thioesterase [Kordia sp.]|uniref:PaaI family thioesterase n=1 Tax=Kordia sp. TaxID=1965332 RepID=UPI003D2CAE18